MSIQQRCRWCLDLVQRIDRGTGEEYEHIQWYGNSLTLEGKRTCPWLFYDIVRSYVYDSM